MKVILCRGASSVTIEWNFKFLPRKGEKIYLSHILSDKLSMELCRDRYLLTVANLCWFPAIDSKASIVEIFLD